MNNLRFKHQIAFLAAVGIVACSTSCSTDDGGPEHVLSDKEIHLSVSMGNVTTGGFNGSRAWNGVYNNDNFDRFSLFAFYDNGSTFLNGVGVSRNTSNNVCTWTNNTVYWPVTENLHFYGFAPQQNWSVSVENNQPVLRNYVVENPPSTDFIFAQDRDCNSTRNNGWVNLEFIHALSRIEIFIENMSPYYEVGIHGLDLQFMQYQADLILPDNGATSANNTGYWTNHKANRRSYNTNSIDQVDMETGGNPRVIDKWGNNHAVARPGQRRSLLTGNSALLVLPQSVPHWDYNTQPALQDGETSNNIGPNIVLMGRVTDTRLDNAELVDDYILGLTKMVVPLNPNNGAISLEPNKTYRVFVRFGDNAGHNNLGITVNGEKVAIPVSTWVTVEDWGETHVTVDWPYATP